MRRLVNRFWLLLPWILNLWIFAQAINGEMHGLLAFFLLMIFVPLAVILNIVAMVYFKGRELFSTMQPSKQKTAKPTQRKTATNYADLPWWSPKKWMNR